MNLESSLIFIAADKFNLEQSKQNVKRKSARRHHVLCEISNGDKDLIRLQRILLGKKDFMNISITRLPSGALSCTSRGGRLFNVPVASFFVHVHPDDLKAFQNDVQSRKENTKKRQIGLKEDETSIINTLPAAMIEEFSDVLNGNTDLDDEDFLP